MKNAPIPAEIMMAAAMVALTGLLAGVFHLPLVFPASDSAAFVGVHYLYPLVGAALIGLLALMASRAQRNDDLIRAILIGVPCYAIVLYCHFNVKLWLPHINPARYDDALWMTDQAVRPLVDACMDIRRRLAPLLPYDANFYMMGFILQFYATFAYYALRRPEYFRELLLAVTIMQLIGTVGYLMMPALGPFIYETGVNPLISDAQAHMLAFYRQSVAHGPVWIRDHGSEAFTAGLGAVPSLHAAGSILFLAFSWRHARPLLPFHLFCTLFILIAAVANRWHYVIDLPFGLLVAALSLVFAARIVRPGVQEPPRASAPAADLGIATT